MSGHVEICRAALLAALLSSCGGCRGEVIGPCSGTLAISTTCTTPGEPGRPYEVHLPDAFDPNEPTPVMFVIHGGGGNSSAAIGGACPNGDRNSPRCLHQLALRKGWVVVSPSGTSSRAIAKLRTWNAGGGKDGWQCVSGRGCKDGVDDIAYFDALLNDLGAHMTIDEERVYATGLSNGGAMSHRLACERANVFAAIAPVGGGNQFETTADCAPSAPVAVLQIHGTADPCWTLDGGPGACLQRDGLKKQGIDVTVRNWANRNGCGEEPVITDVPDKADDGMTTRHWKYEGCRAAVEYLRIENGGHTYPNGHQYLGEDRVGPATKDFGSEVIIEFFERHPRFGGS